VKSQLVVLSRAQFAGKLDDQKIAAPDRVVVFVAFRSDHGRGARHVRLVLLPVFVPFVKVHFDAFHVQQSFVAAGALELAIRSVPRVSKLNGRSTGRRLRSER
jgi:hypothetical protein